MLLLVTATESEMKPLSMPGLPPGCRTLVCGVGPVEATLGLSRFLGTGSGQYSAVVNFGLAGGYPETGLELLDLCLAEREYAGDFGVVLGDRIQSLGTELVPHLEIPGDPHLLARAESLLPEAGFAAKSGNFVTVAGGSGTLARSQYLRDQFHALCENMEGWALARTCLAFGLPFLELRCVSNLVLDRARQVWQIPEAAARCAEALRHLVGGLTDDR